MIGSLLVIVIAITGCNFIGSPTSSPRYALVVDKRGSTEATSMACARRDGYDSGPAVLALSSPEVVSFATGFLGGFPASIKSEHSTQMG